MLQRSTASSMATKILMVGAAVTVVVAHCLATTTDRSTAAAPAIIDRESVVHRHFPVAKNITATSFLALGNGQFGFAVDGTGLQTFNRTQSSLCLLSDMHWHTSPYTGPGSDPWTASMDGGVFVDLNTTTNTGARRTVRYPVNCSAQGPCGWLAANPSRLDLGHLKFVGSGGVDLESEEVTNVNQTLDIWRGVLSSSWLHVSSGTHIDAETVRVTPSTPRTPGTTSLYLTVLRWPLHWQVVDMASSTISLSVVTTHGTSSGDDTQWALPLAPPLGVAIAFAMPANSGMGGCRDWSRPQAHTSEVLARAADGSTLTLRRVIDFDEHLVECRATGAAWTADSTRRHQFLLTPSSLSGKFTMSCTFSDPESPLPVTPPGGWSAEAIATRTSEEWKRFWGAGAFLDLNAGDAAATAQQIELERRVVLSQYLMRAQEHGPLPPQETALIHNSWHGKHHQEMRFWYACTI
jgi:hypothetical protein